MVPHSSKTRSYFSRAGGLSAALILLALLNCGFECKAAGITIKPAGKFMVVFVSGELLPNDGERFRQLTGALPKTTVVMFWSEGGSLISGLEMGETIREKGFQTFVTYRCASACALAWLGGAYRTMTGDAKIGFHAASDSDGQVTGVGNAVIGAYLNKMGLPRGAVAYITTASPDSITWLTPADAKQYGIKVNLFVPPPE
jgi:hypothetical protein